MSTSKSWVIKDSVFSALAGLVIEIFLVTLPVLLLTLIHDCYTAITPVLLICKTDLIGLWYKNNRFMKMQGLCCCCNNNKHAAEVMGESWVKDMLITGLKWKTNSCLHVRCFWATYLTQSSVAVWPRVNICTMKVNYNKILYSFKNKNNKVLLTSMIMITMILVNDCSVLRIV